MAQHFPVEWERQHSPSICCCSLTVVCSVVRHYHEESAPQTSVLWTDSLIYTMSIIWHSHLHLSRCQLLSYLMQPKVELPPFVLNACKVPPPFFSSLGLSSLNSRKCFSDINLTHMHVVICSIKSRGLYFLTDFPTQPPPFIKLS